MAGVGDPDGSAHQLPAPFEAFLATLRAKGVAHVGLHEVLAVQRVLSAIASDEERLESAFEGRTSPAPTQTVKVALARLLGTSPQRVREIERIFDEHFAHLREDRSWQPEEKHSRIPRIAITFFLAVTFFVALWSQRLWWHTFVFGGSPILLAADAGFEGRQDGGRPSDGGDGGLDATAPEVAPLAVDGGGELQAVGGATSADDGGLDAGIVAPAARGAHDAGQPLTNADETCPPPSPRMAPLPSLALLGLIAGAGIGGALLRALGAPALTRRRRARRRAEGASRLAEMSGPRHYVDDDASDSSPFINSGEMAAAVRPLETHAPATDRTEVDIERTLDHFIQSGLEELELIFRTRRQRSPLVIFIDSDVTMDPFRPTSLLLVEQLKRKGIDLEAFLFFGGLERVSRLHERTRHPVETVARAYRGSPLLVVSVGSNPAHAARAEPFRSVRDSFSPRVWISPVQSARDWRRDDARAPESGFAMFPFSAMGIAEAMKALSGEAWHSVSGRSPTLGEILVLRGLVAMAPQPSLQAAAFLWRELMPGVPVHVLLHIPSFVEELQRGSKAEGRAATEIRASLVSAQEALQQRDADGSLRQRALELLLARHENERRRPPKATAAELRWRYDRALLMSGVPSLRHAADTEIGALLESELADEMASTESLERRHRIIRTADATAHLEPAEPAVRNRIISAVAAGILPALAMAFIARNCEVHARVEKANERIVQVGRSLHLLDANGEEMKRPIPIERNGVPEKFLPRLVWPDAMGECFRFVNQTGAVVTASEPYRAPAAGQALLRLIAISESGGRAPASIRVSSESTTTTIQSGGKTLVPAGSLSFFPQADVKNSTSPSDATWRFEPASARFSAGSAQEITLILKRSEPPPPPPPPPVKLIPLAKETRGPCGVVPASTVVQVSPTRMRGQLTLRSNFYQHALNVQVDEPLAQTVSRDLSSLSSKLGVLGSVEYCGVLKSAKSDTGFSWTRPEGSRARCLTLFGTPGRWVLDTGEGSLLLDVKACDAVKRSGTDAALAIHFVVAPSDPDFLALHPGGNITVTRVGDEKGQTVSFAGWADPIEVDVPASGDYDVMLDALGATSQQRRIRVTPTTETFTINVTWTVGALRLDDRRDVLAHDDILVDGNELRSPPLYPSGLVTIKTTDSSFFDIRKNAAIHLGRATVVSLQGEPTLGGLRFLLPSDTNEISLNWRRLDAPAPSVDSKTPVRNGFEIAPPLQAVEEERASDGYHLVVRGPPGKAAGYARGPGSFELIDSIIQAGTAFDVDTVNPTPGLSDLERRINAALRSAVWTDPASKAQAALGIRVNGFAKSYGERDVDPLSIARDLGGVAPEVLPSSSIEEEFARQKNKADLSRALALLQEESGFDSPQLIRVNATTSNTRNRVTLVIVYSVSTDRSRIAGFIAGERTLADTRSSDSITLASDSLELSLSGDALEKNRETTVSASLDGSKAKPEWVLDMLGGKGEAWTRERGGLLTNRLTARSITARMLLGATLRICSDSTDDLQVFDFELTGRTSCGTTWRFARTGVHLRGDEKQFGVGRRCGDFAVDAPAACPEDAAAKPAK